MLRRSSCAFVIVQKIGHWICALCNYYLQISAWIPVEDLTEVSRYDCGQILGVVSEDHLQLAAHLRAGGAAPSFLPYDAADPGEAETPATANATPGNASSEQAQLPAGELSTDEAAV